MNAKVKRIGETVAILNPFTDHAPMEQDYNVPGTQLLLGMKSQQRRAGE